MKKKILITGSSGFIGYHLCKHILSKNFEVIGVDNHNKYYSRSLKEKRLSILSRDKTFKFIKVDLVNEKKLEKVFKKHKPSLVFHLAGQPGVLYSFKNPNSYYVNNVKATKIICKISKKYKVIKFILGSSSSVYGDQKIFPIKENVKLNPKNVYAKTKLKSEEIVKKNFIKTKTSFIIFRFFTVYGPLGRPDMFIHKFLNHLRKKRLIKIYNNGMNLRDFTFIDDVVKILIKSININLNNIVINICRSKPVLTKVLVNLILKNFPTKNFKYKNVESMKGEMLKTHGSNIKLKKIFGKIKFTDINKGLNKTIKSYLKYKM